MNAFPLEISRYIRRTFLTPSFIVPMTVLLLFIVFLFRYLSLRKKKRLDPYSICDEKLLSAKKAVKAAGIIAAVFIALFVGRYAFLGLVMMFM